MFAGFFKPWKAEMPPSSSCRFRFCDSRAWATVVPPNSRRRLPPRYHSMKYRPSGRLPSWGCPCRCEEWKGVSNVRRF